MEKPEGCPEVVTEDGATPSSPWLRVAKDDMSLLESGLLGKCKGEDCYYTFQSKLGKVSNPKLLALMEFFRELYFRRRELLRKMFPQAAQDEFLEMSKIFDTRLCRVKSGSNRTRFTTMQRSLSLGSPPSPGVRDMVEPHELRNERIKVRMIDAGGSGGNQQGGSGTGSGASHGDGNKSAGTNSK